MHHGPVAAREFVTRFLELADPDDARDIWLFPPAVSIPAVVDGLRKRPDVLVGVQNVHWEARGAFTGEISAPMAREAGAAGALIGHSERRHIFGETDVETRKKVEAVLAAGMVPFLCVGETLDERERGDTEAVVLRQLNAALDGLPREALERVVVAYEPVWAIGTGRSATPADAAQVHRLIKRFFDSQGRTSPVPVLYGGSVNLKNVLALMAEPEVDGVLVGGASLEPDTWAELVGF